MDGWLNLSLMKDTRKIPVDAPPMTRREMVAKSAYALAGLTLAAACRPFPAATPKPMPATALRPGFKIGVVDWELGLAGDPAAVEMASRLGFDGVQVDLGEVKPMLEPEAQQKYQALAQAHGIEIASLALGILNRVPYKRDPRAEQYVSDGIDVAQAMGRDVLLLAFFGQGDLRDDRQGIDTLVERLKDMAPKAEQAGVTLGLESWLNVEQHLDIIERVGSPAVKVYFDMVHAHTEGRDIYEEITTLGSHICEFHAKDYSHIMFGAGAMDFQAIRRAMDDIGFRGWIQIEQYDEIEGEKPLGLEETYRRNLQYLRGVFPARI